jgi:hypothetical protein
MAVLGRNVQRYYKQDTVLQHIRVVFDHVVVVITFYKLPWHFIKRYRILRKHEKC